ncbi:MAG: hypothetical protein KA793_01060 [Bacteroidales bacterium]|nr:hypothetical protein [Bacteroidales bacterium]
MRKLTYVALFLTIGMMFSCQKDPMSEINDGDWNKERNIIGITFADQVGTATITRDGNNAEINFTYNTSASADFSAIKIQKLEISYGASSSVNVGDALNFQNDSKSATITITPANGESLIWTVILKPFTETLLGTWSINGLYVYGGTGPSYGGASTAKMSDKPWCWSTTEGPDKEHDNTLTFTMEGITSEGNTYGKIVNAAGADGKYANFIYVAKTPNIDLNKFYRTIPKGEGKWMRNYATGTVSFTFADGTTKTGSFDAPGTYNLGDGKSRTLTTYAFSFTLNGVDDWVNIYTDYDRFVSRPRRYWIDIIKK